MQTCYLTRTSETLAISSLKVGRRSTPRYAELMIQTCASCCKHLAGRWVEEDSIRRCRTTLYAAQRLVGGRRPAAALISLRAAPFWLCFPCCHTWRRERPHIPVLLAAWRWAAYSGTEPSRQRVSLPAARLRLRVACLFSRICLLQTRSVRQRDLLFLFKNILVRGTSAKTALTAATCYASQSSGAGGRRAPVAALPPRRTRLACAAPLPTCATAQPARLGVPNFAAWACGLAGERLAHETPRDHHPGILTPKTAICLPFHTVHCPTYARCTAYARRACAKGSGALSPRALS